MNPSIKKEKDKVKKMKVLSCLIGFVFIMSLNVVPAFADQLSLGGGDGTLYFCSTGAAGSPVVLSSVSGCGTPGGTTGSATTGSFESPTGTTVIAIQPWSLIFPSINPLEFDPITGDVVSPQNTTAFSWGGPPGAGTSAITGDITFTSVHDGTSSPRFVGALTISANGNSGVLGSDYVPGTVYKIDFNVDLGTNPLLEDVFNHTGDVTTTSGRFSSGEVPTVPETSSVLMLGTGMLVAGTFLRLRRRKASPQGRLPEIG